MKQNVPYVVANHKVEQVGFTAPTDLHMTLAPDREKLFFKGCDELAKRAYEK